MIRVYCHGYGVRTPLGNNAGELLQCILEGRTALKLHTGVFGCPVPFVASLFEDRASAPGLSFFESIAVEAAKDALAGTDSASVALVLASIKGNVEKIGGEDVSLAASARRIADALGMEIPPLVVSNACISGLAGLVQGLRMLRSGRYSKVLVLGAEVQSKFIVTGFQSLKALSMEQCKPFDAARDGLNLGEAAAAILLSTEEGPWEIVSGAVRNDANHISGPSRTGEGSWKALCQVLEGVNPEDLAFINVHGTSTVYNDEMEAIAIDRAGLADVPVNALKGVFGHTMGAAGVLESILSMLAADRGVVLPTRGFSTLGVSRPVKVSASASKTDKKAFIKLLSGFGGVNGALLFRKGGER